MQRASALARARVGWKIDPLSCRKRKIQHLVFSLSPSPPLVRGAGVRCRTFSGRRRASGVEPSPEEELRPSHLALACSRPRQMGRAAAPAPEAARRAAIPPTARVCATLSDPTPGAGPRLADRLARARDGGGVHVHVGRDETTYVHRDVRVPDERERQRDRRVRARSQRLRPDRHARGRGRHPRQHVIRDGAEAGPGCGNSRL